MELEFVLYFEGEAGFGVNPGEAGHGAVVL